MMWFGHVERRDDERDPEKANEVLIILGQSLSSLVVDVVHDIMHGIKSNRVCLNDLQYTACESRSFFFTNVNYVHNSLTQMKLIFAPEFAILHP